MTFCACSRTCQRTIALTSKRTYHPICQARRRNEARLGKTIEAKYQQAIREQRARRRAA